MNEYKHYRVKRHGNHLLVAYPREMRPLLIVTRSGILLNGLTKNPPKEEMQETVQLFRDVLAHYEGMQDQSIEEGEKIDMFEQLYHFSAEGTQTE